jgi:ketose-bisphosphate aldolase
MIKTRPECLVTLAELLPVAEENGYAVGAFSPRLAGLIRPVLLAAQNTHSPAIVQISQKELGRYQITPGNFAAEFFHQLQKEMISVPVALHLDHTRDFEIIKEAIDAGFTSVMIDASEQELVENTKITKSVVEYAHAHSVSVEAELGRIGTTDFVETDRDEEYFTVPSEAEYFANETGIDALAVSVGTAHGVYKVRQPRIDCERLSAIRARINTPLVLHGGSGVPPVLLERAIRLPGGGISKVNIATDIELAALEALGQHDYLTNQAFNRLTALQIDAAQEAVYATVLEKITCFLFSNDRVGSSDAEKPSS